MVGAIKLDLRAQEADEFDANLVVVQVDPFFSDAVGLHHTLIKAGFFTEGGFGANGDGGGPTVFTIYQPTGIDAVDRNVACNVGAKIGGGESDGAATLLTMHHFALDECGAPRMALASWIRP